MANRALSVAWGVTGLAGTLAYRVIGNDGSTLVARTTSGVTETPSSSGNYVVYVLDSYAGMIVWDDGTDFASETFAAASGASAVNLTVQQTEVRA